ncbi:CAAX amino terminal protease self- immunity [Maioricimonas rarisocia]|uniref:CAAX amino terminal protease self-immunity n=1 Tax=Maioricimonas rarisocia TaxID=2528026 RepID=A0A517ZA48_9PLAN|nr:CPBP family intramembrane glutamic endopeptidase [Maioricimonas rarisocia]QDU39310.1 CAAX amino terminal protease self- immunity [Maioricimonas rarisocia]
MLIGRLQRHAQQRRGSASWRKPSGPGILESVGWTIGYLVAQTLVLLGFVAAVILWAAEGIPRQRNMLDAVLLELSLDSSFLLTGVSSLATVFVAILAVRLRLGRRVRSWLRFRRSRPRDVILVSGAVLPLAVLSGELYRLALIGWESLLASVPALADWQQTNSLAVIQGQIPMVPYPILIVALALGPALSEEIVFRGLIGRGLLQRYGVFFAVSLTTVLFAAAHVFPPHALATVPLGIFLHLVYLATGNLWLPIWLHFLNNALSVSLLKYTMTNEIPASPVVIVSALLYLAATVALLSWHVPRRDTEASRPVRRKPPIQGVRPSRRTVRQPSWFATQLGAATVILAFTLSFVWSALATASH